MQDLKLRNVSNFENLAKILLSFDVVKIRGRRRKKYDGHRRPLIFFSVASGQNLALGQNLASG